MVESGVISSHYAPRLQNGVAFTAPPTVFGSDERSVLTPSTVRENVPVVRKQAATFYNYTTQPVVFESARTAPAFSFPQPVYNPEPVNAKVGNNVNEPFNGLNFAYQPPVLVPTGYLPPQVSLPQPILPPQASLQQSALAPQVPLQQSVLPPKMPLPPQISQPADSNASTVNNLIKQFSNEPTFMVRPNYPPAIPHQLI